MVRAASYRGVETVDGVGAGEGVFVQMVGAVGFFAVAAEDLEGFGRGIAWVALFEAAVSAGFAGVQSLRHGG